MTHIATWNHKSCLTLAIPFSIYMPDKEIEPDGILCFDLHRRPRQNDDKLVNLDRDELKSFGKELQSAVLEGLAWTWRLRSRS